MSKKEKKYAERQQSKGLVRVKVWVPFDQVGKLKSYAQSLREPIEEAIKMEGCGPQKTLQILDELQTLGFTDSDFQAMHHIEGTSIEAHRKYCRTISSFQSGGSNERLCQSLQKLLQKIKN